MKLASREAVWPALYGALMGALAGQLISELGLLADRFTGVPLVAAGAAAGAVLAIAGVSRFVAIVDAGLFVIYLVVSLSPMTAFFADRWVRTDSLTRAGAVVVLSGGLASNGGLGEQGLDRLLGGLALIRTGQAEHLITTRVADRVGGRRLTTDDDQRRTVSLIDVPKWDVVGPVATTRDEALKSAALLLPRGERHVLVVTSPMHTRRACATFEKLGFTVTCVAAFEHDLPAWRPRTSKERLASFRAYFYERAGTLKYRFRGWI